MDQDPDRVRVAADDVELAGAEERHVAEPQLPGRQRRERAARVEVKMIDTSWSCSTPLRSSSVDSSSPVRPITASDVSASTVVAPRSATSRSSLTGRPSAAIASSIWL